MKENNQYELQPVDNKNPYDIMEYDEVIVLLKEGSNDSQFAGYLKFDKNKNKHFIKGRVVELSRFSSTSIRFLPENNFEGYKDAKKVDDREKLTIGISYSLIDFIVLSFDSFDWKK